MSKRKKLLTGLLCLVLLVSLCASSLAETGKTQVVTKDGIKITVYTKKKTEKKNEGYEISFYAKKGGQKLYTWQTDKKGRLTEDLRTCYRSGLVFMGWYTHPYKGTRVTNKTVFKKNTDVWAHWAIIEDRVNEAPKPGVYTISFPEDDNARTAPFTMRTGEDGKLQEIPEPGVEKKRNLTFLGWRNKNTKELLTTDTVFTGDATMQAVWGSAAKANLTYMSDNCLLSNREYERGTWVSPLQSKPEEKTSPKREFLGWFTAPEGGEQVTAFRILENTVLYAHWGDPGWTVTLTDAFGLNEDGTLIEGNRIRTKADGTLERIPEGIGRGCSFLGWYTDKKLTQPVTEETVFTRDSRIWARTDRRQGFRINLDTSRFGNFRSGVKPEYILTRADGTAGQLPQAQWFASGLERREFLGWFTEDDQPVTAETVFTENTTIYAKWKDGIRIGFASGASPSFRAAYTDENGKLASLPSIGRLQYKNPALGWFTADGKEVTADTVFTEETELSARWGVTVTFFTEKTGTWGRGKIADLVTGEDGTLPYLPSAVHGKGYPFAGWIDAEGNPVTEETVFAENARVFATWETEGKKITFKAGSGGVPDAGYIMTRNDGTLEALPGAHHKNGFPFVGWSTTPDGSSPVTADTVFEAPTTLYAIWKYIYKVSFRADGGTVKDGVKSVMTDEKGHIQEWPEAEHPLKLPFDGWYVSRTVKADSETVFKKDGWLDAHWGTPEVPAGGFTVTLASHGEETQARTAETGKLKDLPVPTRSDAIFHGWYTEPGARGEKVHNGTLIGGDMTFHAAWLLPLTAEQDRHYR